ncbi:thiol-disulfide oxidoreductase DCC family protein [Bacillus sp. V3B]|uniref:thiol-disulfide oxidoreductase DCC family protein n=1 Tax=Bacillus sp. V3B TaxID=2804915 RepID=UPI002109075E|nr:thiol-disulfide oxidoreductase DCC family protein [Bacillus sp. V3B]MCQ6275008.1 thiol-disulfide oxidoreductase DCC family protein [Bacillus sp. V3B]
MERVVLFDGECHFCNWSVQFIIKRDPKGIFRFASLQSKIGQELLEKYEVPVDIDSMVVVEKGKAYVQSDAALRICRHLRGVWKFLYMFHIIPSSVRNSIYDWVAKNRYKWFRKKESCTRLPSNVRKRFL